MSQKLLADAKTFLFTIFRDRLGFVNQEEVSHIQNCFKGEADDTRLFLFIKVVHP